jgi:signal transduction histidine kinase
MSPRSRERLLLGLAFAAFVAGLLAWWFESPASTFVFPTRSLFAIWLSAAGLLGAGWVVYEHPGTRVSQMIASVALAATVPLSAVPLVGTGDPLLVATGLSAAAMAALPLGIGLTSWVTQEALAQQARALVIGSVVVALGASVIAAVESPTSLVGSFEAASGALAIRWLLVTLAIAVPAAAGALSVIRDPRATSIFQARILVPLGLGTAALIPAITGIVLTAPYWPLFALPLLAAAGTAAFLADVAIRPLAREAGSAISQRDLVIAASEAERNRLASALHDGPLGDLALLVQQLDAAGDADNAAIARSIATDLRTIGNDLQLPILEDLGAGPALEWLVDRVARRAGADVRLELDFVADVRPPAEVELAVYRIAHEALLNAIKHGRPPVTVRYASRADGVSLTVDDAGPGIEVEAVARALREGRLGVVSMRQRAEAIGARLVIGQATYGGTHLGLRWTPTPG